MNLYNTIDNRLPKAIEPENPRIFFLLNGRAASSVNPLKYLYT